MTEIRSAAFKIVAGQWVMSSKYIVVEFGEIGPLQLAYAVVVILPL